MPQKVILSADSTCDLSAALIERYQVHMYPLHILLEGRQYADGEISPDALYEAWWQRKQLPKTSAITPGEYVEYFRQWVEDGYQVVHINLGSNLSSAYQNCCIAAEELGNVYPVDSCNLSTGMGLLVIEAAERIAQGMDGRQVQQEVNALRPYAHASFVLDTLEFLHAGGRCSAVAMLGANLLKLKPCIMVDPAHNGAMGVGKKYRGTLDKALVQYTTDQLAGRKDLKLDRVFITHSGMSPERIEMVKKTVEKLAGFYHPRGLHHLRPLWAEYARRFVYDQSGRISRASPWGKALFEAEVWMYHAGTGRCKAGRTSLVGVKNKIPFLCRPEEILPFLPADCFFI